MSWGRSFVEYRCSVFRSLLRLAFCTLGHILGEWQNYRLACGRSVLGLKSWCMGLQRTITIFIPHLGIAGEADNLVTPTSFRNWSWPTLIHTCKIRLWADTEGGIRTRVRGHVVPEVVLAIVVCRRKDGHSRKVGTSASFHQVLCRIRTGILKCHFNLFILWFSCSKHNSSDRAIRAFSHLFRS